MVPGTRITVISNEKGLIIVKVENCEIAMERDITRSIIVE
ncbi:MAG TPA: hypothetical protein EYG77_00690 [Methanothermococcus okinawensis]|nr:hypothetical protein [Methanothermococcus okinawensis]